MKFSIVTASFRQLPWLKRCVRSIEDQAVEGGPALEIEHLIQDGGSGAELEEWVRGRRLVQLQVEADSGIYDALNRGFRRASGEIFSFLNSDEQYLPGTLARVREAFERQPEADLIVGDSLIVDGQGQVLAFRRSTPLRPAMILTDHLYDFTCAIFFRRRLWERTGPFRTDFRAAGDAEWISRALRAGARAAYLRRYLAVFGITGENVSLQAGREHEAALLREITPAWARAAAPILRRWRHLEKVAVGGYRRQAIDYAIYLDGEDEARTALRSERPDWRHPWR